jgi:hypothetical protein
MLSNSVKKSLCIAQIEKLQTSIVKSDVEKFLNSVELAKVICKVHAYVTSVSGKQVIKAEPKETNTQEKFIKEYLGICKQWFNDLKNAGKAIEENPLIVEQYLEECAKVEAIKKISVPRSIVKLNDFFKESKLENTTPPTNESKAGEGETGEGETGEAGEDKAPTKNSSVEAKKDVLTFSFAGASLNLSNVSVRIASDGQFKTSNDAKQIGEAISYLLQAMKGSGLMDVAPAVVEAGTGTAKKKAASKKAQKVKDLHEFFTTDSAE